MILKWEKLSREVKADFIKMGVGKGLRRNIYPNSNPPLPFLSIQKLKSQGDGGWFYNLMSALIAAP